MNNIIFDKSRVGTINKSHLFPVDGEYGLNIDKKLLRSSRSILPELSELEVVRHYTQLSSLNACVDTCFFPLGSCTMKYNPRFTQKIAAQPQAYNLHPETDETCAQGTLQCMYELQEMLKMITGMKDVCLSPIAGAQGELAGVMLIQAYHQAAGNTHKNEFIIPDAAHGTNPASAAMCGYTVVEVKTKENGDISEDHLRSLISDKTAGIMLTNPSTIGIFERNILEIGEMIHKVGGLLYYDGANLNAIVGKVKPADMGFDVMHLNLHKTFATPHGGGGPGCGPVLVNDKLSNFLPVPKVTFNNNTYALTQEKYNQSSIGRFSTFQGNVSVMLRAYAYIKMLGSDGLKRVSEYSMLNANYLAKLLQEYGYELAYPNRLASHEFVITVKKIKKETGITASDIAKRLLDYGFYAPTIYFPLIVEECLLIEPTETESKNTIDSFAKSMKEIIKDCYDRPDFIKHSPHTTPVKRIDEKSAVINLDVAYRNKEDK